MTVISLGPAFSVDIRRELGFQPILGLPEPSSSTMKFGTKLTVPTLQTSGVSKPEQRHGNLQDILNAMSQNQSSRIRKQLDKLSNKSTGSTAPPIDQMDPTINREDSTHTCMLPLDIIFKDSHDMVSSFSLHKK